VLLLLLQDIVPHLPPALLGFQHCPTEVLYQENNVNFQVCSGTNGEDPACSDGLTLPISIPDHLVYLVSAAAARRQLAALVANSSDAVQGVLMYGLC
jgi:hypothetical protein